MKLNRRHFLKGAAGLSAAALVVTLPVREERRQCPCGEYHDDALPYDFGTDDFTVEAHLTPNRYLTGPGEWYIMTKEQCQARGLPWTWV